MSAVRRQVLVVDDDEGLRELLVRYLNDNGYAVVGVGDGAAMRSHLLTHPVDLILLDVMLPGEDGLSLARGLSGSGAPAIIMLSARGEEVDRIVGLEVGADDYLAKPFSHRELLARIAAVLRRRQTAPEAGRIRRFGPFVIDLALIAVPRLTDGSFRPMPLTFLLVLLALPSALRLWGRAIRRAAPRRPFDFVILDGATANHNLVFGLTNDAFGYILTKEDWNSFGRYNYITRTCLGEMTGEIFLQEALAIFAEARTADRQP